MQDVFVPYQFPSTKIAVLQSELRNDRLANLFKDIKMANRHRSSTLVDPTISKLVSFQGVPVPKNAVGTKAAVQVPWAMDGPAEKRAAKTTAGKIFVVIAWILLALNILAVAGGNEDYGWERYLDLEAINKIIGYPIKAIQVSMLAAGACAVSLVTWLCWKYSHSKNSTALAFIIIILLVPLVFLIIAPYVKIPDNNRGVVVKTPSGYPPTKTVAENETVTGILYSADKPSAVIGVDIVHEGDTIHGATIVKIDKKEVHFEKDGEAWSQILQ